MLDAKLIHAAILDADAYRIIEHHADPETFTPTGRFWWEMIQTWYRRDPHATGVDFELLLGNADRYAGRNAEMAREWLTALPACPSPGNIAHEVLELKRQAKWAELCEAVESDRVDRDRILALTDEHHALMHQTELVDDGMEWYSGNPFREEQATTLLPVAPGRLNDALGGGAPKGTHIVVFGRVESGKTLLAVNMVAKWLRAGLKVLYIGNEESSARTNERVRCNLTGLTREKYLSNLDAADKMCENKGIANLQFLHINPGTTYEVEKGIDRAEPDCVVLDQLRNVRGSKTGTRAQSLDRVAAEFRSMLNKYNVLGVSVGQANAGEHGKERVYLTADDYDESRTGVPGSADVMVGIGTSYQLDLHNQRQVSLPKNKLNGNHEGFVIAIDPKRSRVN